MQASPPFLNIARPHGQFLRDVYLSWFIYRTPESKTNRSNHCFVNKPKTHLFAYCIKHYQCFKLLSLHIRVDHVSPILWSSYTLFLYKICIRIYKLNKSQSEQSSRCIPMTGPVDPAYILHTVHQVSPNWRLFMTCCWRWQPHFIALISKMVFTVQK